MADSIEHFSEKKNLARVTAGLKEPGPFYNKLLTPQPMNFAEGYPKVFEEKRMGMPITKMGPILDVWSERRSNSTLK